MAILKTRASIAQIKAADDQALTDEKGNKILSIKAAGTPTSHIILGQGDAGGGPSLSADGGSDADLSLNSKGAGSKVLIAANGSGANGKLGILNGNKNGFSLESNANHGTGVYSMIFPANLPGSDAFLKIDQSGNMSFSTSSASSFQISANGSSQTINSGDVINFLGTANETTVEVSATDKVQIGLPNIVVLQTSLQAPTLKTGTIADAAGVSAITLSGNDVTILGDLTVQGTTVTLNVSELQVEDKNITIAKGAGSAANSDGAGITVGTQAYAYIIYNDGDGSWDQNLNMNLDTASLSYKINNSAVVDKDGAFFGNAGLGIGLKSNANKRAELDVKITETDIASATATTIATYNMEQISMSGTGMFTVGSFFQVFLNGILQRGVSVSNANANAWVDSGSVDYSYDSNNGKVNFSAAQVVDSDLVTIYYTK